MPYIYQPRGGYGRKRKVFRVTAATAQAMGIPRRRQMRSAPKRLNALIRRVAGRQAETKYVADNYDKNGVLDLPAVWTLTNIGAGALKFLPMIPRIEQGTDENERIGDQVSPVGNCVTTLDFAYNDTDVSGHQIKVEIWYGTTKERKSWANINPLATDQFLDNGDGTNSSPGVSRELTMLPTDKRLVSFKKRTFILSKTQGTTGGDNGTGNFSANAGPSFKSVKLTCKAPKKLKYRDAAAVYPTNFAPGYFINLSYCDGAIPVPTEVIDRLVNITSRTHLHFKDM